MLESASYQQIIPSYIEPNMNFKLTTRKYKNCKIPVFIIHPSRKEPFRVKKGLSYSKKEEKDRRNQKILEKNQSWIRNGDSKKEINIEELIRFPCEFRKLF